MDFSGPLPEKAFAAGNLNGVLDTYLGLAYNAGSILPSVVYADDPILYSTSGFIPIKTSICTKVPSCPYFF